jgi:proliferating cell nuclear antigen PCNA
MPVIFKAKTREGYALKVLAELLQNNIKTACFEVDEKGIRLRMMDHHRTILIDLDLEADCFSVYKYKASEKLFLGINLNHFHRMLKSIKKRDSIQLFIDDSSPTDLGIKVIPKENNRVTTSFIKIQNIQNLDIDLPEGYGKPVIVPSGEFQKMCKGLTHISNLTHITAKGFLIRFSSDAGGVMKRSTEFGETEDSDNEEEEKDEEDPDYTEDFDTEQLTRITKLAGLSATMQIYPKSENPLLFRSAIGSLGKISIYLKSKSLQEVESRAVESGDE